jgi:hypothetical protein
MHAVERQAHYIEILIPGDYWDSQIYSGELVLFGTDGSLKTFSWNQIVDNIPVEDEVRLALEAALIGNSWLYQSGAQRLLADAEIAGVLYQRFLRLDLLPKPIEVMPSRATTRANPLPFPHADSDVFRSRLYTGSKDGLHTIPLQSSSRGKRGVSRITDAPALSLAAKFFCLAHAGGSEGLFQTSIHDSRERITGSTATLASAFCNVCEWAALDILASDGHGDLFAATFRKDSRSSISSARVNREFVRVRTAGELFDLEPEGPAPQLSWGSRDKVFQIRGGSIDVRRYQGASKHDTETALEVLGSVPIDVSGHDDSVVAARVAPFGCVIEYDSFLLVVPSVGDSFRLDGEPVRWRVFPRSKHYLNHLHVIYEDHVRIIAFTHDYFVDQRTKLAGISGRHED